MPMSVKAPLRMLARWPGLFIQASTTSRGLLAGGDVLAPRAPGVAGGASGRRGRSRCCRCGSSSGRRLVGEWAVAASGVGFGQGRAGGGRAWLVRSMTRWRRVGGRGTVRGRRRGGDATPGCRRWADVACRRMPPIASAHRGHQQGEAVGADRRLAWRVQAACSCCPSVATELIKPPAAGGVVPTCAVVGPTADQGADVIDLVVRGTVLTMDPAATVLDRRRRGRGRFADRRGRPVRRRPGQVADGRRAR